MRSRWGAVREVVGVVVVALALAAALLAGWWLSAMVLAATGDLVVAVAVAACACVGLPLAAGIWKHGVRGRRVVDIAGFGLAFNVAIAIVCVAAVPDPLGAALRGHGWALSASALGEQHRLTRSSSLLSYEVADAITDAPPTQVPVRSDGGSIIVDVDLGGPAGSVALPYLWDTGATYTTITSRTAEAIGLQIGPGSPVTRMQTAAGDRDTALVVLPSLRIAGREIHNLAVSICDDCEHDRTGGLLGLNAMRFFVSEYDPATASLRVYPRAGTSSGVADVEPFLDVAVEGDADLVRAHHVHWVVSVRNHAPLPVANVQIAAAFEGGETVLSSVIARIDAGETARARVVGSAGPTTSTNYRLVVQAADFDTP